MQIVYIQHILKAACQLSTKADGRFNDQNHSGHPLAEMLKDMAYLSEKIDLCCRRFEHARKDQ